MVLINFEYNKLYLKDILILVPRYHQNMISFLTPILGLYGVNVKEFITELENKLSFIDYDITIPVRVVLSKIKTYEIFIKTPAVTTILSNFENFNENNVEVNFLTIYKISLIKSIYNNNYFIDNKTKIYYKMIRSYFKSLNRNINYVLNYKKKKKQNNNFILNLYNNSLYLSKLNLLRKLYIINNLYNIICKNYGIFFSFSGYTNKKYNYLKELLNVYGCNFTKIKGKFYSLFLNNANLNSFYGHVVYAYTQQFNTIYKFLIENNIEENKSQFLILYIKIKKNLLNLNFFKFYLKEFNKITKYIKNNNNKLLFILYNILNYNTIKTIRLNNNLNIYFLKLLVNKK